MAERSVVYKLLGRDVSASSTFNKVGRSAGTLDKKSSSAGKSIAKAFAIGAVVQFGRSSVKAFSESEQAETRLNTAYEKFPALADRNRASYDALAMSIQRKTRFDDEQVKSAEATLAQFKLTGAQVQQVTPLIADYAARTGQDMPSAATAFGKALLGNTRALKTIGISYKSTGDLTKDYTNITALMRQKVGGFAEKEGKDAAGQLAILRNQFNEVQESVGKKVIPALTTLGQWLLKIIDFIQRNWAVIGPLVAVLGTLAVTIWTVNAAQRAWTAATTAWAAITKVATAAQWLFNIAMDANPIMLVVIAIAALAAGLVLAYQKVGWFRSIVQSTFGWIKDHWPLLLGILTGPIGPAVVMIVQHWNAIKNGFTAMFDWIRGHWKLILSILTGPIGASTIYIVDHFHAITSAVSAAVSALRSAWNAAWSAMTSAVRSAWAAIDPIVHAIESAVGKVVSAVDKIGSAVGKVKGAVGGVLGKIPGLASGGIVTKPTLAVVGEAGPEAVVPLRDLSNSAAGGPAVRRLPRETSRDQSPETREMVTLLRKILTVLQRNPAAFADVLNGTADRARLTAATGVRR